MASLSEAASASSDGATLRFVGGEQRLLAHQGDLLAQALELGVDQLAPLAGVGMRRAPRLDDGELLLEAAAQLGVGILALEACGQALRLLVELLRARAPRRR